MEHIIHPQSGRMTGLEAVDVGTYGEPVLLVGRGGGRRELGGVGGSKLQTVAFHSSRLRHIG